MSILTLTPAAAEHIKILLTDRPSGGIRIVLKTKGCNGLAYGLEYADTRMPHDEVVESGGVTLFVDPKAVMYLIGTVMDYEQTDVESGFAFKNPNEKGRCGCGESFHI